MIRRLRGVFDLMRSISLLVKSVSRKTICGIRSTVSELEDLPCFENQKTHNCLKADQTGRFARSTWRSRTYAGLPDDRFPEEPILTFGFANSGEI